jgi:cell division topological specificity factor
VFQLIKNTLFSRSQSKEAAKNRLQVVLVQDRSGMNSEDMDKFRQEILGVISKYFTVDTNLLDIEWQRSDSSTALIINTPIKGKRKEKIAAVG